MADNSHDDASATPPDMAPQDTKLQATELDEAGSHETEVVKEATSEKAVTPKRQKQASEAVVVEGGDEEEETWTNKPADATAPSETEANDALDGEEEEEEDEETPPVTRKAVHTGRDVVCEELPLRAQRAKDRLRPYLAGALIIELSNSGEKFLFDWRGDEAKVSPFSGEVLLSSPENTGSSTVDCVISVSENHLMAIRSGDLNPQVAILADKIKVKGKMSPAVYLFNLVAPRVRPQ